MNKVLRFNLPFGGSGALNRIAEKWQWKLANCRAPREEYARMWKDVMQIFEPSGVYDSGATSSCGYFLHCGIQQGMSMKRDMLISTWKFADAGYVYLFEKDQVKTYDGVSTKINVSEEAILR
ncbi:hypothetical protein ACHAW6_012802 [Cyclotella cf. meneghiniana]